MRALNIRHIRTLSGPNVYHHKPVLVMTLELGDLAETHSADLPGFADRLVAALPGLEDHRCSFGHRGGFVERLRRGTYFGHIIEHIALELSGPAGIEVGFGKTVYAGEPGIYRVVVRYESEPAMKQLLRVAVELAQALAGGGSGFDLGPRIAEAREIAEAHRLGPSTQAIVAAAEARGIPWIRLNDQNLIQFGYGRNRRLIQATTTGATSDIAVDIAQDKGLTKRLLERASIRVPRGESVGSADRAVAAYRRLGVPVAVKPLDGNHGRGVSLDLRDESTVAEAYRLAEAQSRGAGVLVEEHFAGDDFRVLVVGGKYAAAARRIPAHVVGDGRRTVHELIDRENENPLRGEGHEKPLTKIRLDAVAEAYLRRRGIRLDAVPAAGCVVALRETANLSTGGLAFDVTDEVHPQIRSSCERAARIVGLDICGIDLVVADIRRPLAGQRGGIIEVNAGPGIRMHLYPARGRPRDVGAAIVESMYPGGASARVPIIAVTGTNGKTTVTRLIGHVLAESGARAGMTTSDGIYIGRERIVVGDTTGPESARAVLGDPDVEAAVLETARGGILRRGLGFDWADVGVLTNVQADHLGQDGIGDVDDVFRIKSLVAERVREGGTLVLNADDARLASLPEAPRIAGVARKVAFFSLRPGNARIERHVAAGGTAYLARAGRIYEITAGGETFVIDAAEEMPLTFGGTAEFQIANALAALAACRAYGLALPQIARGLRSFRPDADNSGRANLYRVGKGFVLIDYGHNPEAFRAVAEMTARWEGRRVTGVLAVPGDRSDEMIRMSGRIVAHGFDSIIIRQDVNLRGRASGEVARMLREAVRAERAGIRCDVELDERRALERAVAGMGEGDVVAFFYDDPELVRECLAKLGAEPLADAAPLARTLGDLREAG